MKAKKIIAGVLVVIPLVAIVIYFAVNNSSQTPSTPKGKQKSNYPKPTNGTVPLVKVNKVAGYSESSFYMGETEVTVAQWEKVMPVTPSLVRHISGRSAQHPIEGITWEQAALFCNALSKLEGKIPCYDRNLKCNPNKNGYRLPTSSEWAMACYGNKQTAYPWGDDLTPKN